MQNTLQTKGSQKMTDTLQKEKIEVKDKKYVIIKESDSLDAPPLDFSFKHLKLLEDLLSPNIIPTQGKKKEIVEIKNIVTEVQKDQNLDKQEITKGNEQELNIDENQKTKQTLKTENEPSKKIEPEIIRVIPNYDLKNLIKENNKPLQSSLVQKTKVSQESMKDYKADRKVVKINRICTTLKLCYNQLRSLFDIGKLPEFIMDRFISQLYSEFRLRLQFNKNFEEFVNLKSLYLHCNYIKDFQELTKLSHLIELRTFTIHGNPIETVHNFRFYVMAILQNVRKIDTVLVSKKEKDNAVSWIQMNKRKQLPIVIDAVQPPVDESNKEPEDKF